jgi:uncharacterized protein YndB with AHSA1/START domain
MKLEKGTYVEAQMLIRKPIDLVFNAFIDPTITTQFWFTHSSGNLQLHKEVEWIWEMYQVVTPVLVMDLIFNEKISIDWGNSATKVDFLFKQIDETSTYVTIYHYGFPEKGTDLVEKIKDSTGGFTTVLDGLKAYLEYGIHLHLIRDKFLH